MKHYCRYCIHCIAQDETEAVCEELSIMIKKTSVRDACKLFDFCEVDAFYICRSENPEAVSYTHLDVYKRQGDECIRRYGSNEGSGRLQGDFQTLDSGVGPGTGSGIFLGAAYGQ